MSIGRKRPDPTPALIRKWVQAIEDGLNGEDFKDRFGITIPSARTQAKRAGVVVPPASPGFGTSTDEVRAKLTKNTPPMNALPYHMAFPGNRAQRAARKARRKAGRTP